MPSFLRVLVVAFEANDLLTEAALVLGLLPHRRGLGEGGALAPGFDEASARVVHQLDEFELRRLSRQGRALRLTEVVDMGERALDSHRDVL